MKDGVKISYSFELSDYFPLFVDVETAEVVGDTRFLFCCICRSYMGLSFECSFHPLCSFQRSFVLWLLQAWYVDLCWHLLDLLEQLVLASMSKYLGKLRGIVLEFHQLVSMQQLSDLLLLYNILNSFQPGRMMLSRSYKIHDSILALCLLS